MQPRTSVDAVQAAEEKPSVSLNLCIVIVVKCTSGFPYFLNHIDHGVISFFFQEKFESIERCFEVVEIKCLIGAGECARSVLTASDTRMRARWIIDSGEGYPSLIGHHSLATAAGTFESILECLGAQGLTLDEGTHT